MSSIPEVSAVTAKHFLPVRHLPQSNLLSAIYYIGGFVTVPRHQCFICKANNFLLAFNICLIKIAFTQFLFLIISRYLLPGTLYSGLFTQWTADKLNLAKIRVQTSSPTLSWRSCHHHNHVGGHTLPPPASMHIQIRRNAYSHISRGSGGRRTWKHTAQGQVWELFVKETGSPCVYCTKNKPVGKLLAQN